MLNSVSLSVVSHPQNNFSLCRTKGLGSNAGEDMDVCKCIAPSQQGGTLKKPIEPQVFSGGCWKGKSGRNSLTVSQGVPPQNLGEPRMLVAAVAQWLRSRTRGRRVMSSSPCVTKELPYRRVDHVQSVSAQNLQVCHMAAVA
ncbi:hypothetical protein TNCV_533891 [Trichonephila clavipes]|nr:hypothetical protein TNCV_533891 [Trichonephila clavipes]